MKSRLTFFACLLCFTACQSQPDLSKLTPAQWEEDLRFFMENAPKTHVSLYHAMTKEAFEAFGNDLLKRIPELTPDQITSELVRWTATIGDGHSHLFPENTQTYPMHLFWFEEGLFLVNASGDAKPFLGWQLTHIEGMDVAEVSKKIEPYQHRDNGQQIKAQAPVFLCTEEALAAAGVLKKKGEASFTLKNPADGAVKTVAIKSKGRGGLFQLMHAQKPASKALYRQKQEEKYWFTWLPDTRTLYFQYNEMRENEKLPVADFLKKLAAAVERQPVEKFVVDLRWNGGGNLFTSKPVVEFIANHPKINQRGKLFVLIGRHTFSAASWFATALEFRTKAIFVGEPTGASPNHYGDTAPLRLPNSGLTPRLSTIFWQNSFPWDARPATPPDLHVEPTAADWFADRDADLDAVFAYRQTMDETAAVPEILAKKIEGRYLLQDDKLLEIKQLHGKLMLLSEDFIQTELHLATPGERLSADVRSVFVSPIGNDKIRLEAMGGEAVLQKLDPNFRLPSEMVLEGDILDGIAAFRTLYHQTPKAASVGEAQINNLGYRLMGEKKMDAAQAIFKLNTELYPHAFNTWDSLAEWHKLNGDKAKAIVFYKKSLELNPQNENGKRMLKELE